MLLMYSEKFGTLFKLFFYLPLLCLLYLVYEADDFTCNVGKLNNARIAITIYLHSVIPANLINIIKKVIAIIPFYSVFEAQLLHKYPVSL